MFFVVVDGTVQVEIGFITEPDQVDPIWVWEKLQFLREDMPD